ncbi:hypothetical protein C9J22_13170 [Photobacterium phosphoreum]|uniref:hypothetical protein n=1 Tax=Photobacterium phosphoreum TaxID=659 RepID=UPI000D173788|nr:hypothetical protein [Photobacterium phosphoreum]PSU69823.1 hypothetical protein C9J22_13170 [Photobacterium phosphoreum]
MIKITDIVSILGLIVTFLTIIITFRQFKKHRYEKAKDLYDIYSKIKPLSKNVSDNYSEILIILSSFVSRPLSIAEVEWFIKEPRAFLQLELFGVIPEKYIMIDLNNKRFELTPIISTVRNQILDSLKVIVGFGGLYFFSLFFIAIIFNFLIPNLNEMIKFLFFALISMAYFFILNSYSNDVSNAKKLARWSINLDV